MHRGKLLIRGVLNGEDYTEKLDFSPSLYVLSQEESEYKTLQGQNLKPIKLNSISDARRFRREYATQNSPVFGLERFHYQYIGQEYPNKIDYSKEYIKSNLVFPSNTNSVFNFIKGILFTLLKT